METAKLFRTGRSQAVRLPKAFRFEGDAVRISRVGKKVVLEPLDEGWDWLEGVVGQASADFMAEGRDQPESQEREALGALFR
jgi:antitoxin VapB